MSLLWSSDRPTIRLLRIGLNIVGAGWFLYALASRWSIPGFDTYAYWSIDPASLYSTTGASIEAGAYRYSPVVAQLMDPLGVLPWGQFFVGFLVLSLLALTVLGGRVAFALILIPNVLGELFLGNIDLFVAISLAGGLIWPAAWAFLLLTKVTPGVVLIWFVVRGEWRKLLIVLVVTGAIALPSLVTTPGLWTAWVQESLQFAGTAYGASAIPLLPRIVAAALLVAVGARKGWRWTVPIGGTLAMPGLDWKTATTVLGVLPVLGLGMAADHAAIRHRLTQLSRGGALLPQG